MSEIMYDAACVDCRRDLAQNTGGTTWQCGPHVRAERDWLRARLAMVLAEAEHDIAVLVSERDEAVNVLREIATHDHAKAAKVARRYFAAKEGK